MEKFGIDARYTTDSLLEDFVGNNFRNMLIGLQKKHNFSMTDKDVDEYVDMELGRVTAKLSEKCKECPGVTEQLEWAKAQGYPMSVVSTSAKPRVVASLQKTNLMRFFKDEHVYSAATSMDKPSSKPDPKIYLYACEQLGVKPEEVDDYVAQELGRVTKKLSEKCVECPGVTEQLEWAKSQGYPMSVVSTSAKPRVIASLEKTNLMRFFTDATVYSAATSLNPPSSKPDPAIYLHACKELGVKPEECLTVEDSKSGATAGMRAGIPLIAYVGIYGLEEGKEKEAQMAKTLTEQCKAQVVMYDWKEFPEAVKKIEASLP